MYSTDRLRSLVVEDCVHLLSVWEGRGEEGVEEGGNEGRITLTSACSGVYGCAGGR